MPWAALACSWTRSTKASRELGVSGTPWSGQVVNCSCFTLRAGCWAAWGWGSRGLRCFSSPLNPGPLQPSLPSSERGQAGPPHIQSCPWDDQTEGIPPLEVTAWEGEWGAGVWGEAGALS